VARNIKLIREIKLMEASDDTPNFESTIHTRGLERVGAEVGQAQFALVTAAELLVEAKEKADDLKFGEALMLSRDAIRMASSAILFKDGLVAADFDSSYSYLTATYGDKIPIAEWKAVESLSRSSIVDRISAALGLGKKGPENNAKKAIESATRFIEAAGALVGPIPEEMLCQTEAAEQEISGQEPDHIESDVAEPPNEIKGEAS